MAQTRAEIRLPEWLARRDLAPGRISEAEAMRLAIDLARENVARKTGGPFGAVIRSEATGKLVSAGVNIVLGSGNPVLHAEVVAISLAGAALSASGGVTLFSSCEPCIMCLGAAHWAGISQVISAALREDAETIGFSEGAGAADLKAEMAGRGVMFSSGLLRQEAGEVLRGYAASGGAIYGPDGA
jgi:tRNA(Arg) A34 adenosine deaminase TadA